MFHWFSAACAAAKVHRNYPFRFQHQINLLNLKESSDRSAIVATWFLKLPHLDMLMIQKCLYFPKNLVLETFDESLIVLSTKVNLLHLLYLIKQNCLLKLF